MTPLSASVRRRGPVVAFTAALSVVASGMAADRVATPRDVAFSTEIAPLLRDACAGCHGETEDEGGLRMHTLASLLAADVVKPGAGAASLLVRKMRGVNIDGQRMPLGGPPVPDDAIARVEAWIDQGARGDVLHAAATLDAVVAAGLAARLSDAELAEARRRAAEIAWREAIPDDPAAVEVRERVTVVGNLTADRLAAFADVAADVEDRVRRSLMGDDGRLLKGGVVVFAFRHAVDYSAFWQQLVGGERPKGLSGHAGTRAEAVYGAVLVPSADPDTPDVRLLLTEQVCSAALLGRGAPDWFARGAGRAVAMRLVPQAPLVQEWKRAVPAAVRDVGSCASFLGGHAPPGPAAVVAGGFVGSLGSLAARLGPLVDDLDTGTAFDDAFTKAFRAAPPRLYEAWAAKETRRTSAKR